MTWSLIVNIENFQNIEGRKESLWERDHESFSELIAIVRNCNKDKDDNDNENSDNAENDNEDNDYKNDDDDGMSDLQPMLFGRGG